MNKRINHPGDCPTVLIASGFGYPYKNPRENSCPNSSRYLQGNGGDLAGHRTKGNGV
ncbi:MAG: hypothetical protein WC391_08385 [Methanoregula sp.]